MAEKVARHRDKMEVIYDPPHWEWLRHLRKQALSIMGALDAQGIRSMVHGSVARGDVDQRSDVDIFVPYVLPSYKVELALTMHGFEIYSRKIAQATPGHAPKGHIYLNVNESMSVTFPLVPFRTLEFEFYKFGGMLDFKGLKADKRVPGCTKTLMLMEPTPRGHFGSSIQGREAEVAKIVGINVDIVVERVRVLTRRDRIGRTGIFLLVALQKDESFEEVLKRLIDTNPIVRRRCVTK